VTEPSAWGSNFVAAHSWLAWGLNRLSHNCGGRVSPIPMAGSGCNAEALGRTHAPYGGDTETEVVLRNNDPDRCSSSP